jgi:CubicO group peptidase (beta-lactamase class C family)
MHQPGERWMYNTGTLVLGVLLARASGTDLGDLLRRRVFAPLDMTETGFFLSESDAGRLPLTYMTNPATGVMEEQTVSPPELWTRPPVFPSASGGLLSTVDDYLAFARLMASGGVYKGQRLLAEESVRAMTTNQLTHEQVDTAGVLLSGRGWSYGMSVTVDGEQPGRYGWEGGSGTVWFNDPATGRIGIALSQTSDFIFNGGSQEFIQLASR